MSRIKNLFSLESIFEDGTIGIDEHLFIHKSFVEDPYQFTLYNVSIDLVDARMLLNFAFNVLDDELCGLIGPRSEFPLSNLAINILPRLFSILRRKICPFSANFRRVKIWDSLLYKVAMESVFHNNSKATWKRIFSQLILHDIESVPNFDGSNGTVNKIHLLTLQAVESVQCGDLQVLKDTLQGFNSLSNWVSPSNVSIKLLNGWSLLHLAASTPLDASIYTYLIEVVGCDVLRVDGTGRTALHVAAASLNYPALQVLATRCPTAVRTLDYSELSPLDLLLRCISMRVWRKSIESHHLQKAITLLLIPNSNPGVIWDYPGGSKSTEFTSIYESVHAKSNHFYCAIVYTDEFIAEGVIQLAGRLPVSQWNVAAIQATLLKCATMPWSRRATVELLFTELYSRLLEAGRMEVQELLEVVDSALCAAIFATRNKKHDHQLIKSLLERYETVVGQTNSTVMERNMVFPYLAVLSGDAELLAFVLATLPRDAVKRLVYAHPDGCVSSVAFNDSFVRKLCRFCSPLNVSTIQRVFHASCSPLSLACAFNLPPMVHALLRACYEIPAHSESPAGRAASEVAERKHFYPLWCAVQAGSSECMRLIQNSLNKDSLARIYFRMTGSDTRNIFQESLRCLAQDLEWSTSTKPSPANYKNKNKNNSVTTKCRAECLQLVLECLPVESQTFFATSPALLETTAVKNPSHEVAGSLCVRLEQVDAALNSLRRQAYPYQRVEDERVMTKALDSREMLVTHWSERRVSVNRICTELNSKYVRTSLRLMCKRFSPDKKWVKLAYCINRLMRALRPACALDSCNTGTQPSASSSSEDRDLPSVIDLSHWKSFLSFLTKASKTTEQIANFTQVLADALRNVFTPHALLGASSLVHSEDLEAFYRALGEECQLVEQIMNDNQIMVMTKLRSPSPVPYGASDNTSSDASALPHYQINDFKPDQRDVSTYAALQAWLVAFLRDVKARCEFTTQVLPALPRDSRAVQTLEQEQGSARETVLNFLHQKQLQCERDRIASLLALSTPAEVAVSPVTYLLRSVGITHNAESQALEDLAADLRFLGVLPTLRLSCKRFEANKVSQATTIDKVLCVLVEYNRRLGVGTEALLQDVLPLSALKMWKSAELIIAQVAERCPSLGMTHYNLMQQLIYPVPCGTRGGDDAILSRGLSQDVLQVPESHPSSMVVSVNPLHYAVKSLQESFVKTFLSAFPDFPVHFDSIVQFSEASCVQELTRVLFAHCSHLRSHPVVRGLQFTDWSDQRADPSLYFTTPPRLVAAWLDLANAAAAHASELSGGGDESSTLLYGPFTLLRREDGFHSDGTPRPDSAVKLMNGTTAPWCEVVRTARLLALAIPAPQRAGGLFCTGHSLLHQASLQSCPDLAARLLRTQAAWRERVCQADASGCSPLYSALRHGHTHLADEMLTSFEHSKLTTKHSIRSQTSTVGVRENVLLYVSEELHRIEKQLIIPRLRKEQPGFESFYGIRDFNVNSTQDALARYLQGIELMWTQITHSDPAVLMQVFQFPGGAQLDSVVRARQVMALLGVPLSQLALPRTQPAHHTTATPSRRGKDFTALHPAKLKALVAWPTAVQLRGIVCGWYRMRTATAPSALDDTQFLFRNAEVSMLDMGQSGVDVGTHLRKTSAYQRACDRVRQRGVETHSRVELVSALGQQLRMEFRFDNSSAARENMLRPSNLAYLEPSVTPTSSAKVNCLLSSMQMDAATCANVLSLSYLILDFARAVCVARQLTGVTSLPTAVCHPLDELQSQIAVARVKVERFTAILGLKEEGTNTITNSNTNTHGVEAPIRVCATLTSSDLQAFFAVTSATSPRFVMLREFLVEGLSSVLLDQEYHQLGEFVCRQALTADLIFTTTPPAPTDTESSTNVPRVSSKFAKIVDPAKGFDLVLAALQKLRVVDCLEPKGNKTSLFAKKYATFLASEGATIDFQPDGVERETLAKVSPTVTSFGDPHILRDVSAYAAKREKLRGAQEAATTLTQSLENGYATAQILFDLITAAIHLPAEGQLYAEDVHQHIMKADKLCPLVAVCLRGQRIAQSSYHHTHHSLAAGQLRAEADLACSRRLLSLGALPTAVDCQGRSAIEVAVLGDRQDLLRIYLEGSSVEALRALPHYSSLVWHSLLVSTVGATSPATAISSLQLLLQFGFPAEAPPGCDYSCIELAILTNHNEEDLLRLCEARRSTCSPASLLRAVHYLLLRGPQCPLSVLHVLLQKLDRTTLDEIFAQQYALVQELTSETFVHQVVKGHVQLVAHQLEIPDYRNVENNVWDHLRRSVNASREGRHKKQNLQIKAIETDLTATVDFMQALTATPTASSSCDIFELAFSTHQDAIVALILSLVPASCISQDDDSTFYFCPLPETPDCKYTVSHILHCACVCDASTALRILSDLFDQQDPSSWSSLFIEPIMDTQGRTTASLLQVAVDCNSTSCVEYILSLSRAVHNPCGILVKALTRGKTGPDTALVLLKYLAPSKDGSEFLSAEHGDLTTFLTCTSHADGGGALCLEGETLLHLCCRRGYAFVVKHLLELGADPLNPDVQGYTSLEYSIAAGHCAVTRLMYPYCSSKIHRAVAVLVYMTRKLLLRRRRTGK